MEAIRGDFFLNILQKMLFEIEIFPDGRTDEQTYIRTYE